MTTKSIQLPEVSFKVLTEGKSTLTEAYSVCVQAQSVDSKVRGAMGNVFDIIRYTAVGIYRDFLTKADNDPSKINLTELVGVFLLTMEEAEASFSVSERPDTWKNYKSKLKLALEGGFNLHENSTVGFNKITTFLTQLRKEEADASDEAAKKAAIESGKMKEIPAEGSAPSKSDDEKGKANATFEDAFSGLSPQTQSELATLIEMVEDLDKSSDPALQAKMHNCLKSAVNNLSASHVKALAALAA